MKIKHKCKKCDDELIKETEEAIKLLERVFNLPKDENCRCGK